jgi:hypothetical protein
MKPTPTIVQAKVRRVGWVGVGFGKDVGGGQVEEDAGEKPEVEPEDRRRNGEDERDGGTRHGGEGVGDEQDQRPPAVVPVQRGDGVGVEPSAKSWLSTAIATARRCCRPGTRPRWPRRPIGCARPARTRQRRQGLEAWRRPVYSPCPPSWPRWIATERSTTCRVRKPRTAASMANGTPNSWPGCWVSASGTRSKPTTPSVSPAASPRMRCCWSWVRRQARLTGATRACGGSQRSLTPLAWDLTHWGRLGRPTTEIGGVEGGLGRSGRCAPGRTCGCGRARPAPDPGRRPQGRPHHSCPAPQRGHAAGSGAGHRDPAGAAGVWRASGRG